MKKTKRFSMPKHILSVVLALMFFAGVLLIPRVTKVNADIGDTYIIDKQNSTYLQGAGSSAYEIWIEGGNMPFYGPPLKVSDAGGDKIIEAAYCISRVTPLDGTAAGSYIQVAPKDFFDESEGNGYGAIKANEAKLRWIAANGFIGKFDGSYDDFAAADIMLPAAAEVIEKFFEELADDGQYSEVTFKNLTAGEAVTATQAALWHYSDYYASGSAGTKLDRNEYLKSPEGRRILAFYDALVHWANILADDWDESNRRVSLEIDFGAAEAMIIKEENGEKIKAYGPLEVKIITQDVSLVDVSVELCAYMGEAKWDADKVVFAYDESGEKIIEDGIIKDFSDTKKTQKFYMVFARDPAEMDDVGEELQLTLKGEAAAKVTLTTRPEPVIFVAKDEKGNASWSSQAVIACVPQNENILKDVSRQVNIKIPRISALIQKREQRAGSLKPGPGYRFEIWEYDENAEDHKGSRLINPGDPDNVFTTDQNGQILLKEKENGLKPGRYRIEELAGENTGIYRLIQTDFTVTGHSSEVNRFEFDNNLIEIKFIKTVDGVSGEIGAGFDFGIWEYSEGGDHKGKSVAERVTTDSKGEIKLYGDTLPPGRYWIEELENDRTAAFAVLVKDEFTVEVSADKTVELNNQPAQIKFKKTLDPKSSDTPEDFEFDIYNSNSAGDGPEGGALQRIKTDSNGEVSVTGLPEGRYWIAEVPTAKSDKYRLVKEAFAVDFGEFKNGVFEVALYNGLSEVELTKTVDRGSDTPEDFEFDIYKSAGDGPVGEPVAYIKTDSKGKAVINLPKGKYWIKERLTGKSKDYFLIDEEFEVTNEGENQIDPLRNYLRNVLIEKDKLDENGNIVQPKDVTGITFRIFSAELLDTYKNQTKTWQQILEESSGGAYYAKEFSLGIDGTYMIEGIAEGEYWITELAHEKNSGYYLVDEKLTISPDDARIAGAKQGGPSKINVNYYILKPIKNIPAPKRDVTVEKSLRNDSGSPLDIPDSAVYTVRLTPSASGANRPAYTFTLNKDNGWSHTVTGVFAGEYTIAETSGGEGYDIFYSPVISGTLDRVSVTEQENAFKFTVTNRERPVTPPNSVTVGKEFTPPGDAPDDDDIEFTIVLKQENAVKYTLKVNKANAWKAKISNVVPGTYDVQEINIPDGYEMVSLSHTSITVDSDSSIMITAVNKKETPTTEPPTTQPPTTEPPTTAPTTVPTTTPAATPTTAPVTQPAATTTADSATQPGTTTTQATTPATAPATTPTTEITKQPAPPLTEPTQPENPATEPAASETTQAPATESPTQPVIDTPETEEEEDEPANQDTPLGGLSAEDDDTIPKGKPENGPSEKITASGSDEYEDINENTPPLLNITVPEDSAKETTTKEDSAKPNPDTGDGGALWILVLMIGAAGIIAVSAEKIRRKPR